MVINNYLRQNLISNFNINVHNIELSPENNNNNSITITLPRYNFLLIEYGNKNGGQSYGGNTTVICGKTNTDKPCFVPVYLNNELLGFNSEIFSLIELISSTLFLISSLQSSCSFERLSLI